MYKSYPRLTRPPLNLEADESRVMVERLLKALRKARPTSTRQFFKVASRHSCWELNDVARRLDREPVAAEMLVESAPAPARSRSGLAPEARRILETVEQLPEEDWKC